MNPLESAKEYCRRLTSYPYLKERTPVQVIKMIARKFGKENTEKILLNEDSHYRENLFNKLLMEIKNGKDNII